MFRNLLYFLLFLAVPLPALADPSTEWTDTVQAHLDIYSLLTERRDSGEEAVLRGDTLFIKYRQDLRKLTAEKKDQFLCQTTRWLLAGRLYNSKGLGKLLEAKPTLKKVKLIIYGVDTSVSPNAKGKYTQKRKLSAQLILTIERERLGQLNLEQLKTNLTGVNCARVSKTVLSKIWFAEGS